MKKLSIVVPCYNEEESIPYFYDEIKKVTKEMKVKLELIFVDDGSTDKTLTIIKKKALDDKDVKVYLAFPWFATLCIFFAISSWLPRKKWLTRFILSSNSKI